MMSHDSGAQKVFHPNQADVANWPGIQDIQVVHLRQSFDRTVSRPYPFSGYLWTMAVETSNPSPLKTTKIRILVYRSPIIGFFGRQFVDVSFTYTDCWCWCWCKCVCWCWWWWSSCRRYGDDATDKPPRSKNRLSNSRRRRSAWSTTFRVFENVKNDRCSIEGM